MLNIIKAGVFDSTLIFKNAEVTPERTTEYYEIELYISGKGESMVDGKAYGHEKGNLLFIPPDRKRYSRRQFTCFYVHLHIDSDTEKLLNSIPAVTKITDYNSFKNCFTEIISAYENRESEELFLQSRVYVLLDMLLKNAELERRQKKLIPNADISLIQAAIEFIEANYSRDIKLCDIAAAVNLSPTYFHRIFKIITDKTPHEYLTEKRFSTAKAYLLTTDYPMTKIIEKCGFSSHSYFDYNFKQRFGITPTQFRKQKYRLG